MADRRQSLGPEGGTPPAKRARLPSESCGKLVGTKVGLPGASSLSLVQAHRGGGGQNRGYFPGAPKLLKGPQAFKGFYSKQTMKRQLFSEGM